MTPEDFKYFDEKFTKFEQHANGKFDDIQKLLDVKIGAVNVHLDDKLHAVKSSVAEKNQQNRIDLEQMYEYHKEHFETAKIAAKLEASVHGVDHQGGLVREVQSMKEASHAPPCTAIKIIETRMATYAKTAGAVCVIAGIVLGFLEFYK